MPMRLLAPLGLGLSLLGGAVLGWTAHGAASRSQMEGVVHDYLLAHPEILPQAIDKLRAQEANSALSSVRDAVETPWPGAVLGNPHGRITLVEFTDYSCGYCRRSVEDVTALIAAHPDLRVVVREEPILAPQSVDAARMALAAAAQGKYPAFHAAMFAGDRPGPASIAAAARAAGVDMGRARAVVASSAATAELRRNVDFARQLDLQGTPGWVVGDAVISGAVGRETLDQAIEEAEAARGGIGGGGASVASH